MVDQMELNRTAQPAGSNMAASREILFGGCHSKKAFARCAGGEKVLDRVSGAECADRRRIGTAASEDKQPDRVDSVWHKPAKVKDRMCPRADALDFSRSLDGGELF